MIQELDILRASSFSQEHSVHLTSEGVRGNRGRGRSFCFPGFQFPNFLLGPVAWRPDSQLPIAVSVLSICRLPGAHTPEFPWPPSWQFVPSSLSPQPLVVSSVIQRPRSHSLLTGLDLRMVECSSSIFVPS